ncbi:MAG: hypothetical protein IJW78_05460 [Clostridia bacterium]|nr:hypothetical protein [Clostridia bacterium]MBQ7289152.1 hypothetical protein [Clostridia bacterium]
MLLIPNIKLPLGTAFDNADAQICKQLRISPSHLISAELFRRSIDCRKKEHIHYTCSYLLQLKKEDMYLKRLPGARRYTAPEYTFPKINSAVRPMVVGFGPAGMFAAYVLALCGLRPIVFERGMEVEKRTEAVQKFMQGGEWNPLGNIQFGEGGAGTFSDGKLNSGISNPYCRFVLQTFVECGADPDVLIDAKPHIGTDVLRCVIKNLRLKILSLGGEIHFESCLSAVGIEKGRLTSVRVTTAQGEATLPCSHMLLAIGHSARDTFRMLYAAEVPMEAKPFAVGARIEHKQEWLNKARYGDTDNLPPADYHLSTHLPNGRGVFTFCMCPGGVVVNAKSDPEHIVTNGMSYSKRDGENANSALLTGVSPEDFGTNPLDGLALQEQIEAAAFRQGAGRPVCQTVGDFLNNRPSTASGKVTPSVKPDVAFGDIAPLFPEFVVDALRQGIPALAQKLPGFDDSAALLTAPETRSSSPVRILRNIERQSQISGIYPCGEGAGYAGGILSAAVDGIVSGLALAKTL